MIHDLKELDDWISENRLSDLRQLNGRDDRGFDLADTWSAKSPLFGENGLAQVADALYNIGFGTKWGSTILDSKGKHNASLEDMSSWINAILADDLADGSLYDANSAYATADKFADARVFAQTQAADANGTDGWQNIKHQSAFNLREGTIAFRMNADTIPTSGTVALVSKDARKYGDGGHTTVYIQEGVLYVRLQTKNKSHYIRAETDDFMRAGSSYNIALVFGAAGTQVYVDGQKVASDPELTIDWTRNNNDIVLGAHGGWRSADNPDFVYDVFDGTVSNFGLYNRALSEGEIAGLAGAGTAA